MTCPDCNGTGGKSGTYSDCSFCNGTGEVANIPATLRHDAGAVARCSYCRRYTLDPAALSGGAETPRCDCGDSYGWSGSFEPPGPDAVWSHDYRVPAPPSVPSHGPMTCQEHGPTVTMGWTSGGPDACPLCSASRLAYEARVEAGEAMLALESAEHRLAAAQAEAGRLRKALSALLDRLDEMDGPLGDILVVRALRTGQQYAGPNWSEPYVSARAALSASADDEHAEAGRLRKALRDFGVHRTDCRSRGLITGRDRSCTCGLAAAKEETE